MTGHFCPLVKEASIQSHTRNGVSVFVVEQKSFGKQATLVLMAGGGLLCTTMFLHLWMLLCCKEDRIMCSLCVHRCSELGVYC